MAKHPLETKYGLTSAELLDAVQARFRLQVAIEGAVAEFQMAKHIDRLIGSAVDRYEQHDLAAILTFRFGFPAVTRPYLASARMFVRAPKKAAKRTALAAR